MPTMLDELGADEAMPHGASGSARAEQHQAQLELFEIDSSTSTFPTYVEDDPIIRRRVIRDAGSTKWIQRIAEQIEEIVPYWSWQTYISNLVDALTGSVAKKVRDILKKAARKVAVKTAQGQPPFHKYSNYRPKSCPVFRFGPQARGPPEVDRLSSNFNDKARVIAFVFRLPALGHVTEGIANYTTLANLIVKRFVHMPMHP